MEQYETVQMLWPILTGGVTFTIVSLVKSWLDKTTLPNIPAVTALVSGGINYGLIHLLSVYLAPEMTLETKLMFALGGQYLTQVTHSVKKTKNGQS